MDLNKPITLPGRGKKDNGSSAAASSSASGGFHLPRGKEVYPSKTTINLMVDNTQIKLNATYTVLAFAAAVILIGIFCKFCVVDPLAGVAAADAQVAAQEQQLAQLKEENADFADVASEYERYVVKDMTAEEYEQVRRSEVFDLVDSHFSGVGYLASLGLSGNTLTVTLLGANMSDVSKTVASLEADKRVSHVTVTTAQGQDTKATSATITIQFVDATMSASASEKGGN